MSDLEALAREIIDTKGTTAAFRSYAHQLENEIERRGLENTYLSALIKLAADPYEPMGGSNLWALLRATPEQRARAFLEATHDHH